ncbi:MAG: hypothetical protein E7292_01525 [Lachnospiraceae bacterium]|nr:hypothetical protein [Lachnospiraceae bacterium]
MTDNEVINALSHMMEPVNSQFKTIESSLNKIQNTISNIESDIKTMQGDIKTMQGDITTMQGDISDLKNRVKKIELTQENIILPRLQNIESCYTSTFDRYKKGIDEHESMKQDISVLKTVVTEHSLKLQRIS